MRNREINQQLQRLEAILSKTTSASGGDVEVQSHWAKYLCVLCAGLLENAITEIYGQFVKGAASEPVANYAMSELEGINNPKSKRFVTVARSFKQSWGDDLEVYLAQEGRGEAIDSIMTNRHLIAHGKNSNISMVRVKEYLKKSVEVLEYIESQCSK